MNTSTLANLSNPLTAYPRRLTAENALPQHDMERSFSFAQLLAEHNPPNETANDNALANLYHQASPPSGSRLLPLSNDPRLSLPELLPLPEVLTLSGSGLENVIDNTDSSPDNKRANAVEDEQITLPAPNNADAALLHGFVLHELFALLPTPFAAPAPEAHDWTLGGSPKEPPSFTSASTLKATSLQAIEEYSTILPVPAPLLTTTMASILPPSQTTDTEHSLPPLSLSAESAQTLSSSPLLAASPLVSSPSSSLVNTPTAPSLSAQLGSAEWQQALGQQIIMFQRHGQQHAELRLHPQELGALQITLKLDDNQAQLHIASAQGGVRSAVEAALPYLRLALADQGITLGQSSVGHDPSPSSQHAFQQHHSSSYSEQNDNTEENLELISNTALLPTANLAANGIDTFA